MQIWRYDTYLLPMSRDNVVILGAAGGREHALEQAMLESDDVNRVVVSADPQAGLEQFKLGERKPFVIISAEQLLVDGLADYLRAERYTVFGASKDAAWYEGSKSHAVRMMEKENIPHPKTYIAETLEKARGFVHTHHFSDYVIKYDQLAQGKGAVLADSADEARVVTGNMWHRGHLSGLEKDIVNFAERHTGPELSVMVVVGGGVDDFVVLPFSQDHKRLKDGDKGPNTGGMGAYAPVSSHIVSDTLSDKIYEMSQASLIGMKKQGADIRGQATYLGVMLSEQIKGRPLEYVTPVNLEFNMRFGDPEAQVIITQLQKAGVDVYRFLRSAAEGQIERPISLTAPLPAMITVCLAAEGYAERRSSSGEIIHGLDQEYQNVMVYYGAARKIGRQVLTGGGREIFVTAWGENIDEAAKYAYGAIGEDRICFSGMQYRTDIGSQARQTKSSKS